MLVVVASLSEVYCQVNLTSSAVNGVPSDHMTPCLSLYVTLLPSLATPPFSTLGISAARIGMSVPSCAMSISGSSTRLDAAESLVPCEKWTLRMVGACQYRMRSRSALPRPWPGIAPVPVPPPPVVGLDGVLLGEVAAPPLVGEAVVPPLVAAGAAVVAVVAPVAPLPLVEVAVSLPPQAASKPAITGALSPSAAPRFKTVRRSSLPPRMSARSRSNAGVREVPCSFNRKSPSPPCVRSCPQAPKQSSTPHPVRTSPKIRRRPTTS